MRKTKPFKKIKETDEIFSKLKETHDEVKDQDNVVRLSFDTKERVKIGDFSRGDASRVLVKAADHDFSKQFVTPWPTIHRITANTIRLNGCGGG